MAIDTNEANLYRTGAGSAFVWGKNKALGMLQQQMEQERLRKAKEDVELSEQIGKLSLDGVREQDLPEVLKDYSGIKETFTKLRGTTNQMERIKLQSELKEQQALALRKASLSKEAKLRIADGYKLGASNPDDRSDFYTTDLSELNNTSTFDPKFQERVELFNSRAISKPFDQLGTNEKILKMALENVPESGVKTQNLGGGKLWNYTEKGTRLNKESLIRGVESEIINNKPMQRQAVKLYPNLTIEQATKAYADDLYEQNKARFDKLERSGVSVQDPREKYDFYDYRRANPMPQANIYVGGQPENLYTPMGDEKNPTGNFLQRDVKKIPTAAMNFAGSPAYDFKTGKPLSGKLPSSNDYQIVTVSNMDFITKGNQKGNISQPDFAKNNPKAVEPRPVIHVQLKEDKGGGRVKFKDLIIPYDRLPQNLSKQNREILKTFIPAKAGQQTNQETKQLSKSNKIKASENTLKFFKGK